MKLSHNVYVVSEHYRTWTERMWTQLGYQVVQNPDLSDILCFTGGEDVDPQIYGEKKLPGTCLDPSRDSKECQLFRDHVGIRGMVGICRGAQLLNVLNGGKLWQDVDEHEAGFHDVDDLQTGESWLVNTLHHQGIIPGVTADIIATTHQSKQKVSWQRYWHKSHPNPDDDIEACYYEANATLCVQFHPEFPNCEQSLDYFKTLMDRYYS